MTSVSAESGTRRVSGGLVLFSVVAAAAIFAFDLSYPLGVAGGVPYVVLVLLGLWWPRRAAAFDLAAVATALTVLGFYVSPPGGVLWMVLTNRTLALFAIWVTAVLVFERRRSEGALKEAHDGLEQRVAKRTAELERANLALRDEIAERKRAEEVVRRHRDELEARVAERTAELRALNEQLLAEVAERKEAEEALCASEARLREAQRLARLGYWEWDTRTDEVRWSEESHAIFGVTLEDLGGTLEGFYALVHPDDRAHMARVDADARDRKKPYSANFRIVRPDGELRHIYEVGEPSCDETGRVIGVSGTIQDVTEHKRLEQQLIQASKLATLGEMAAGIAHEINQPLHVIRMMADDYLLLIEEGKAEDGLIGDRLEVISGQGERMAEIIDHMRVFGRVDDGAPVAFDPASSVMGAIDMVGDRFLAEGVSITAKLTETCRPVRGRPVRLEQVVLNLLNNARDAIVAQGQHEGRGASGEIDVAVIDDGRANAIRIVVADSGGGVPAAVMERIFDPFVTTKEEGKGTGLGLSISYGIIAEMGGTIEAKNAGKGARFEITVPVRVDPER
jgi:PAS domain S-box-containing protein